MKKKNNKKSHFYCYFMFIFLEKFMIVMNSNKYVISDSKCVYIVCMYIDIYRVFD